MFTRPSTFLAAAQLITVPVQMMEATNHAVPTYKIWQKVSTRLLVAISRALALQYTVLAFTVH